MTKILLVEDDIALREIYSARFTAEDFDVITASDGEEALTQAIQGKPDLVILDIMMPKISGMDVLDILRSTPETKNTKIIIMSALSQASDIERGKELGADAYLVKSQSTLSDVVDKAKEILARPPRGEAKS
ncbi:MAG: response regulator [bacterium]|nr:response regulator [bacterium]